MTQTRTTVSGRTTAPLPRWDATTERKLTLSLRRLHTWLLDEADIEAERQGLLRQHPDRRNPSQADLDGAHLIVFGTLS